MALRPDRRKTDAERRSEAQAAQEGALMREVDEAVRQDQYADFGRRYGIAVIAVIALFLVGFGGYLYWRHHQIQQKEHASEKMTLALDQVQAGNLATADKALQPLAKGSDAGAAAVAQMMRAGIAAEQGHAKQAGQLFDAVANDDDAPQALRDLATLRSVAVQYDTLKPGTVVARLQPIAVPGNAYFGSAGEILAAAYLDQGKKAEAGKVFAAIAKDKNVPDSLRSRSRQMAGVLGVDAIQDVDQAIAQSGLVAPQGPAGAPPQQ